MNIVKRFGDLEVLRGVNLSVDSGEVVSIVGASGAGKTTLLQILGTLGLPDGGDVSIGGQSTTGMSRRELSAFRNANLGFVFQFHRLLPEFNALENVLMPAWIAGAPEKDAKDRWERFQHLRHARHVCLLAEHLDLRTSVHGVIGFAAGLAEFPNGLHDD